VLPRLVTALLACCLLALGTAQAMASGVLSSFTLTPGSTQAGSDPNVTADLTFSYGASTTDSVKRVTIMLAPGLLASIANVPATCSPAQLTANTCPAGAQIGTGSVTTNVTPRDAKLYLMPAPSPGDAAGFGVVVLVGASVYTGTGTLDVVTGAGGQPVGKVDVSIPVVGSQQVNEISATMNDTTTDGRAFTRLPTSCSTATSSASVETEEASTGSGTDSFLPTGCSALGYAPSLSAVQVIRNAHDSGAELIATLLQSNAMAQSATKALELAWPPSLSPFARLAGACLNGTPCKIGTAKASSPLAPPSYLGNGTVTLGGTTAAPTLTVAFPAPLPLSIVGTVDLAASKVTFSNAPDLSLSALTVDITGPSGGKALSTTCAPGDVVAKFTPQSGGATVTSARPIVYWGCPPPPSPHKLKIAIRYGRSLAIHRRARVQLACSGGVAGSACRGRLSLTVRKRIVRRVHHRRKVIHRTIVLAHARYTVASGETQTVALPLTDAGLRLLERSNDHHLRVRATATVSGGAAVHRAIVVRLQPPSATSTASR
jgi:hypothetical protein